jgi:hypothetical protein
LDKYYAYDIENTTAGVLKQRCEFEAAETRQSHISRMFQFQTLTWSEALIIFRNFTKDTEITFTTNTRG